MPFKEVTELRKSGKLEEALTMANQDLEKDPTNIWNKRSIAWVYHEYLKEFATKDNFEKFINYLNKLKALELPADEKMVFDSCAYQIGKLIFSFARNEQKDYSKIYLLFELTKHFHYTKPSDSYVFLFKAYHKVFKESDKYIEFADWWGLDNFTEADFKKDELPNGTDLMSIAEQAYICYAKKILEGESDNVSLNKFDNSQNTENTRPSNNSIIEKHTKKENHRNDSNFEFNDDKNKKGITNSLEKILKDYTKSEYPVYKFSYKWFCIEKAKSFLLKLNKIINKYPQLDYPLYYKVKIELKLLRNKYIDLKNIIDDKKQNIPIEDSNKILKDFLPFARRKRKDFWVWELIGEIVNDEEETFSCYCKALLCESPDEMLINLRQKMAILLIKKQFYNEAKTEIIQIINTRNKNQFRIPKIITEMEKEEWYKNAISTNSNINFYKKYSNIAEDILFVEFPENVVIVDFVNCEKKMLHFIASETKFGYFKYDKNLSDLKIGDVLKVRFKENFKDVFMVYTATKIFDENFKNKFVKSLNGMIKIDEGKIYGFINDCYIHPSLIKKYFLKNNQQIKANAIYSYNKEKNKLAWKVFEIITH